MSDITHLINGRERIWAYNGVSDGAPSSLLSTSYEVWKKSWAKGCTMLVIWGVGAGAGGGGGFTKAVAAAGGGGGGGGGGSTCAQLFPLDLLPDVLYLYVPKGGRGAAAGGLGSAGNRASVLFRPALAQDLFTTSNGGTSAGGGGGTAAAAGVGGAAATVATTNSSTHWMLAVGGLNARAGIVGGAGGAHTGAAGASPSWSSFGGGAGGAGSQSADFAGGSIAAVTVGGVTLPAVTGGLAGPNVGASGYSIIHHPDLPLLGRPGAGGGSTNTAATAGGRGGDGGIGCGGGGGGAGTSAGGGGGDGGNAFILLTCF